MDGVVDVLLADRGVGREKTLVDREATQVEAVDKRSPLEPLQVIVVLALHLAVENLYTVETHVGGEVDALVDVAELAVAELPEGVSRDGDAVGDGGPGRGFI